MFFFGIFGVQNKSRVVKEFNNVICRCGRLSSMQLIEEYMYFHFFFIPIFRWGRKYFVQARCCGRLYEVPEDYKDELLTSDTIDLNRLREKESPYKICPSCGKYVDSNYKYCPYCGAEL
ncbi:MAG TPA: zinc ribbon domain-containing protein [Clostridiaceae bacterium]|jgi:hypothetical protein|nr:zinc ribbon domain-containing protein [Clostridiaceae bacterium]